jgi:transposase
VTSRRDIRDVEVAFRMFERWRQENFFKYLREEYALDVLVDHRAERADPDREVPNPKWNELRRQTKKVWSEIVRIAMHYGIKAYGNVEALRRTMRGFKIANAADTRRLTAAIEHHMLLEKRRASVPKRVPVKDVVEGQVVRLAAERKHLTNLIKMVAYQIEGDLVRLVAPHYKRAGQEGRTLVQAALASPADIEVTEDELRVTLAPQSSRHRTAAVGALCEDLNRITACFPATKLRMRFEVAEPAVEPGVAGSRPPQATKSGHI